MGSTKAAILWRRVELELLNQRIPGSDPCPPTIENQEIATVARTVISAKTRSYGRGVTCFTQLVDTTCEQQIAPKRARSDIIPGGPDAVWCAFSIVSRHQATESQIA